MKNQLVTAGIITAAAGVGAYFIWKKRRQPTGEENTQHIKKGTGQKHAPRKHITNAFHNAKAAMNGVHALPA